MQKSTGRTKLNGQRSTKYPSLHVELNAQEIFVQLSGNVWPFVC